MVGVCLSSAQNHLQPNSEEIIEIEIHSSRLGRWIDRPGAQRRRRALVEAIGCFLSCLGVHSTEVQADTSYTGENGRGIVEDRGVYSQIVQFGMLSGKAYFDEALSSNM